MDDNNPKGRTLPYVVIRDLSLPTPDELEYCLRQAALQARIFLEARNETGGIKRVIIICDDRIIEGALAGWAASLEPGWRENAVPKFNN